MPDRSPTALLPVALCVVALLGGMGLSWHFDRLMDAQAAAQSAASAPATGEGESARGPLQGWARIGGVGGAAHIGDTGEGGTVPARLGSAVASAVDEQAIEDRLAAATAAGGNGVEGTAADGTGAAFAPDRGTWVDPRSSLRSWRDLGAVEGLLTFRGNPTRSWYGRGPVPSRPGVLWSTDIGCSVSWVGSEGKEWCGSGWTGQPAVFRAPTTKAWWVAFGAYNRAVNFLDPATGASVYPAYVTGDIIKGSVTIDPDGYPLLYTGSRDDYFHVVALDRPQPEALWRLWAHDVEPTLWNNDWDGSSLVIDDYLFEGGENGRFYVVKLNRGYDAAGLVKVDPEIVFTTESWDAELLAALGDVAVSVENSVAISGDTVYFANSGGLVQGWDISGLEQGRVPTRVLRFWTGDDTDASLVIDGDGMLYVVSQYERGTQRSIDVGQIMKLDPSRPDDPLVWSRQARAGIGSGVWATPALYDEPGGGATLIVATNEGAVLALDTGTGEERWTLDLPGPLWSSPVVVDDVLIQADCGGNVNAFDLGGRRDADGAAPARLWSVSLGGCIESTPAVWDGRIFVGTRMGRFHALGDG